MGNIKLKTGDRKTTVSREAVREAVREVMNVRSDTSSKVTRSSSIKGGSKTRNKSI